MIWLASYPRSGNTFTRNILKEVYSMDSSYDDEPGWESYPIVKTHHLPQQIKRLSKEDIVIYLVRDGRDCIVSLAHHMKDIAGTGDHLLQNMSESTIAAEGSYFGGWSTHVFHWLKRADWVIRYEDLIADPIGEMEKLRAIIKLPEGKHQNLPTFEQLKQAEDPYGIVRTEWEKDRDIAKKFYRKGKAGSWKQEMPAALESLFWSIHGDVMEQIGYSRGDAPCDSSEFRSRLKAFSPPPSTRKIKVLLEAQKLMDVHHDGVFRYVHSLVKYMQWIKKNRLTAEDIEIDLLINGQMRPLYSEIEEFKVNDEGWVKKFKAIMWKWYASFPKFIQRISVRIVNAYYALKSGFFLWKNRALFEEYDLLHFTLPQNHYVFRHVRNTPMICTLHDMTHDLFPEHHLKRNVKNAQKGMAFIERNEVQLICVSEATKRDVLKYSSVPESNTTRIYESADREKFYQIFNSEKTQEVLNKFALKTKQYIFSLATLEPRKNLKRTLEAFVLFKEKHPESEVQLALGGKQGWKEKLGFKDRDDIIHLGYVSEGDLPFLYNGALFFLYCSMYEGFGLPLLESMRCGVPVVFGNNSSMSEIVSEGGYPVDAQKVQEITAGIEALALNETLRKDLGQRAYQQALAFSWVDTVTQTFEFYRKVVKT